MTSQERHSYNLKLLRLSGGILASFLFLFLSRTLAFWAFFYGRINIAEETPASLPYIGFYFLVSLLGFLGGFFLGGVLVPSQERAKISLGSWAVVTASFIPFLIYSVVVQSSVFLWRYLAMVSPFAPPVELHTVFFLFGLACFFSPSQKKGLLRPTTALVLTFLLLLIAGFVARPVLSGTQHTPLLHLPQLAAVFLANLLLLIAGFLWATVFLRVSQDKKYRKVLLVSVAFYTLLLIGLSFYEWSHLFHLSWPNGLGLFLFSLFDSPLQIFPSTSLLIGVLLAIAMKFLVVLRQSKGLIDNKT